MRLRQLYPGHVALRSGSLAEIRASTRTKETGKWYQRNRLHAILIRW